MKSHIRIIIKQIFAPSGPELGLEIAYGSRWYYSAFMEMNPEEKREGESGTT